MLMDKAHTVQKQELNVFAEYGSYEEVIEAIQKNTFHPIGQVGLTNEVISPQQIKYNYLYILHPECRLFNPLYEPG